MSFYVSHRLAYHLHCSNKHFNFFFVQVGEKFRSRALKFPGLISGCTINWFQKWPKDALVAVSQHFLGEYAIVSTPEVKQELINIMGLAHDRVSLVCVEYFDRYTNGTRG